MTLLIRNGRLIDPSQGMDQIADILIEDGKIRKIGQDLSQTADRVLDASDMIITPGLVDMHTHLRDPGLTHKEDIETGTLAAVSGGFTAIVAMPNTKPVCDSAEILQYVAAQPQHCKVYQAATITKGMSGGELTDFAALQQAGAIAISDDGRPVESAKLMQEAMVEAKHLGLAIISHCEDLEIIDGGIINKGAVSEFLGVKGMDRSSEDSITAREIALAEASNSAVHIAHVSTRGSTAILRDAKARGAQVTAETCPHYFMLTEEVLKTRNANFRMNPPLREEADRQAILQGICDGTFDAITTDHAPHAAAEKADFEKAPNGIIGLETSLALCLEGLVHSGLISISRLIEMMAVNPRRILRLDAVLLQEGCCADLTVFNPNERWNFSESEVHSKSCNSPFIGRDMIGRVHYTIINGEIRFER